MVLAAHAPSRRVLRVAPRAIARTDLGECVGPEIEPLLRHLGVWEAFLRDGHRPSSRSNVAWGSPHLASNDRLFQIHRVAWRLDRQRFDTTLRKASAVTTPVVDADVISAAADDRRVTLCLSNNARVVARFAIDATGRRAVVANALGGTVEHLDRLVSIACPSMSAGGSLRDLTVESDPMGWWYATDRADGSHVVVRMSDTDLVHHAGLRNPAAFGRALMRAPHVGTEKPTGSPTVYAASSRRMLPCPKAPLIAAGDAAWTQDPISGEGIVKALRAGFFAAYTASDFLATSNPEIIERYQAYVTAAWSTYGERLTHYYGQEGRWSEAVFWQRRVQRR